MISVVKLDLSYVFLPIMGPVALFNDGLLLANAKTKTLFGAKEVKWTR